MLMNKINLLSLLVIISLLGNTYVDVAAAEPVFIEPEPVKRESPIYPKSMARNAIEGVVEVLFMVKKDGTVYAPIALMSTNPEFERSALNAVMKYKYQPATMNGEPLDSHYQATISYHMQEAGDLVSRSFARNRQSVIKELAKGKPNKIKIEAILARMRKSFSLTHYALAYLAVLEVSYAEKFGSDMSKLKALERLFLFERRVGEESKLLDEDTFSLAKTSMLSLRLRLGQLGVAVEEYADLQKFNPQSAKAFEKVMSKVKAVIAAGKPFSQKIEIGHRAYEEVYLVATKFRLEATSGELYKLTFRCQKGFSEIDYQSELEYVVPSSWGECSMQVSGTENATASLIQYK